jgi:hypothetical protein
LKKISLVGPNELVVLRNHPPSTNLETKRREIIMYMKDLKEQLIALN